VKEETIDTHSKALKINLDPPFRCRHHVPHDGFDGCTHVFVLSIHFWFHGLLDQLSICILIYVCGLNPPNTTFLSL